MSPLLRSAISRISSCTSRRCLSLSSRVNAKVTLVGANGSIGSSLSLLLKHSPYITDLSLFDVTPLQGPALDLSHIDTSPEINFSTGTTDDLVALSQGSDVVVISAGVPRKPGMDRSDLYETNAKILFDIMKAVTAIQNFPFIAIVTNPVNSMVPLAAEILKKKNVFDPRKLCGITTLDVTRANTFYAQALGMDPREVHVPVVGGHEGSSIVPLFSHATPPCTLDTAEIDRLVEKVQNAGTEVVKAKQGQGSASLSMAYAANSFITSVLQARLGKKNVIECCLASTKTFDASGTFFSEPRVLGTEGIMESQHYDKVTDREKAMILKAHDDLMMAQKKAKSYSQLSTL